MVPGVALVQRGDPAVRRPGGAAKVLPGLGPAPREPAPPGELCHPQPAAEAPARAAGPASQGPRQGRFISRVYVFSVNCGVWGGGGAVRCLCTLIHLQCILFARFICLCLFLKIVNKYFSLLLLQSHFLALII